MHSSSLRLACFIEDEKRPIVVDVPAEAGVLDLQKIIHSHWNPRRDVNMSWLDLWKPTEITAIVAEPVDTLHGRVELMGTSLVYMYQNARLSRFFPTQPSDEYIHIIVKIANRMEKHLLEEDDMPISVKRLKQEIGKAAPSSLAMPEQFQKISGPGHCICFNRPFETATLPLVLLDEAFVIFKDRCEQPPSMVALACLNELAPKACEWYMKEMDRRETILEVLRRHLGLTLYAGQVPWTEYITDGNFPILVMPASLREGKNEHGNPLNQAIAYYGKFLLYALNCSENYYNFATRFPCILLVNMGSYFTIYGAIWDGDRVRVEPLTPGFDLATHWRERKAREAMASSLDALVLAVENIRAHYKKIVAEARVNPAPKPYNHHLQKARKFPFVTSYVDGGQETSLTYVERLDEAKLLFSAFVKDDQEVACIVKFAQQYSEAAHRCLASYDLAPTLWCCIRISAEWTAVVMDRSSYKTLYDLNLTKDQQEMVWKKVEKAFRVLHEAGFVHGDVRDTNILVDPESLESESDVKIHIVDFDWAGHIGEAKYPNDINMVTVKRPEEIKGRELITVEHDQTMVSYLFT